MLADPELAVLGATLSAELYSPHRPDHKARSRTEEIVRRAVTAAEAREKAARQSRRAEVRAQLNPRRWLRPSRRRRTCPQTDLPD